MDCSAAREALSALLDGEAPGLPPTLVHRHLAVCASCQAWEQDVTRLTRTARAAGTAPTPDLAPTILKALAMGTPRQRSVLLPRLGLLAVALVQLAVALPALHSGIPGASLHVGREIGAWDLALATGFLLAAWRPTVAGALLPLVVTLVIALAATGAIDVTDGRISVSGEGGHGIEMLGLALLWLAAHPFPLRRLSGPGPREVVA